MSANNYKEALQKVLVYEGGYSNDAADPGGATMYGITHIDYDAYRKMKALKPQDVRKMTVAERDEIYRKKYWDRPRCDELPSGVDFAVFDASVNSGIAQGIKWLQRAVGVTADGAMGDVTLAAVLASDPVRVVSDMCDQRLAFLKRLRTWPVFGKGWGARVANVKKTSIAWARDRKAAIPPELHKENFGNGKAKASDIQETTVSAETAGAGTVATSVSTGVVQQLQDAVTPLAETLQIAKYILLGLSVLCAGYAIYAIWQRRKNNAVA